MLAEVTAAYPNLEHGRLVQELVRRLINAMVSDLLAETRRRLAAEEPRSAEAVRALGRPVVGFSDAMAEADESLKSFLFDNMYSHYKLNRAHSKARRVVGDLFRLLLAEPECLPTEWRQRADGPETHAPARVVADFIAGMTDRFVIREHERIVEGR